MSAHVAGPPSHAVFSITGSFDPFAASRFHARLADLAPEIPVVLDFSRASQVSDLALAVLASAFEHSGRSSVMLRGLTQHQERMLRYLGIERTIVDACAPGEQPA